MSLIFLKIRIPISVAQTFSLALALKGFLKPPCLASVYVCRLLVKDTDQPVAFSYYVTSHLD